MSTKKTDFSSVANTPVFFPAQQRTDAQKDDEYFIQCVQAGISLTWWNLNATHGVRSTRKNKIGNYNLINDIIDKREVERVINPHRFLDMEFPLSYKNYPLLTQNINLLSGEERRRYFNPVITVINEDAVSDKIGMINQHFNEWAAEKLMAPGQHDPKDLQKEIERFNKWKLNYRDQRERMAQSVIDYGYKTLYMKDIFSSGFEDFLVSAEEIYVADIYGGEPILRRGHPLCFYTLRSGVSPFIEDSDIIIEDGFLPIGEVLDRFHDELSNTEVTALEKGNQINRGGIVMSLMNTPTSMEEYAYVTGEGENIGELIMANKDLTFTYGGYFDTEGNVRVTRVVWKGMRKLGLKTFKDDDGNEQKKWVPEGYIPNAKEGETVKWLWVGEWYEGTRIGQDIYVRMQVLPNQSRHMDNPSKCSPGIVGTISNIGTNKARSFVDLGENYQYLYNAFMYRLEQLFIKSKGKIGKLPLHLIPDGWTMDKWLYYAEYLGWAAVDNFNEGTKGNSLGKLAGNMNDNSSVIDLSFTQDIQQCFLMLDFISKRCDDLVGISPQRKGAVENRETVGGVERAVTQSSLATEKWYSLHDNTKVRALKAYLEVCKLAWRKKSFKRPYILDDGSMAILDMNGPVFAEAEYGIDISTATSDQELMQTLKSNVGQMIQNQTPLSVVIDLYRTKDPGTLQRKIEAIEAQKQEAEQSQQEAEQQQQQAELQHQQQIQQESMDLEYEKLDRIDFNKELDREVKLQETELIAMATEKPGNESNPELLTKIEESAFKREELAYQTHLKNKELEQKQAIEEARLAAEQQKATFTQKSAEKIQRLQHQHELRLARLSARTKSKIK